MSSKLCILALLAVQLSSSAYAFRSTLQARSGRGTSLARRAAFSATTGNTTIGDDLNTEYFSPITVGGVEFSVQLDTGSSDLNIFGTVTGASDTNIPISVSFAQGEDDGLLSFADVEFAGYTVQDQIFNHAPQNGSQISLLGLGPTTGSVLAATAAKHNIPLSASDTLLNRIFQQDTATPNFMTINLGRQDNPGANDPKAGGDGDFTIGEILPSMEAVSNMPRLPVVTSPISQLQHWAVTLDGATGPDGQPISFAPSVVPGTPIGKVVTVFDTGFTLPQVTKEIADGFYQNVPGAKMQNLDMIGPVYTLPCDASINASFTFQGQTYPIHPLDLNINGLDLGVGSLCFGPFQPIQDDALQALDGVADMILGMGFLRNVYMLLNFGDFVDESADATFTPYVQLLSTTEAAKATADFAAVRTSSMPNSASRFVGSVLCAVIAGSAVLVIAGL